MSHQPSTPKEMLCLNWSHLVQDLLGYQWKLWDFQYQIGVQIMESMLTSPTQNPGGKKEEMRTKDAEKLNELERLATERLRKGLSPPREIYELPYRERINWAGFPAWARPTDPELFEECSHEG